MASNQRSTVLPHLQPSNFNNSSSEDEAIFAASALAEMPWFSAAVNVLAADISKASTSEQREHAAMCFQAVVFQHLQISSRPSVVFEVAA